MNSLLVQVLYIVIKVHTRLGRFSRLESKIKKINNNTRNYPKNTLTMTTSKEDSAKSEIMAQRDQIT